MEKIVAVLFSFLTGFLVGDLAFAEASSAPPEEKSLSQTQVFETLNSVVLDSVIIDEQALSQSRGLVRVNMVAGDANSQLNAGALALGHQQSVVGAEIAINQMTEAGAVLDHTAASASATASVKIATGAFDKSIGMIAVNQVAGQRNRQFNGVSLAVGSLPITALEVDESLLQQSSAETDLGVLNNTETTPQNQNGVSIANDAFVGVQGVVQINQVAGTGNVTANNFALRLHLGASTQ